MATPPRALKEVGTSILYSPQKRTPERVKGSKATVINIPGQAPQISLTMLDIHEETTLGDGKELGKGAQGAVYAYESPVKGQGSLVAKVGRGVREERAMAQTIADLVSTHVASPLNTSGDTYLMKKADGTLLGIQKNIKKILISHNYTNQDKAFFLADLVY